MRLGEGQGGDPHPPVGLDGGEQVPGGGARILRSVGGQARFGRESVCRERLVPVGGDRSGEDLVGDPCHGAADDEPQPPVVGVGADDDVDVVGGACRDAVDGAAREDVPVDHGLPRHGARHDGGPPAGRVRVGEQVRLQGRLSGQQPRHTRSRDRLTRRCDAELVREVVGDAQGVPGGGHLVRGTALQDRPPEQAPGPGHGEQGADAHGPGGLTEDGDVVGVAAERGDVVPHPLEGSDLVEQPQVCDAVPEVEEALCAGSPVDDDAHHAVASEVAAVVCRRGAELEHAALDPHHHRQPGRQRIGRPEVEVEAVLRRCGTVDGLERRPDLLPVLAGPRWWSGRRRGRDLWWLSPEGHGVADPRPRRHRLRGSEAVPTEGRRRIRNPEEAGHAVGNAAAQLSADRSHHSIHVFHGRVNGSPGPESKVPGTLSSRR